MTEEHTTSHQSESNATVSTRRPSTQSSESSDRPQRTRGDAPQEQNSEERSYAPRSSERGTFSDRPQRSFSSRPYEDRPQRSSEGYSDRPRSDRPFTPRSTGGEARPYTPRSSEGYSDRPRPERSYSPRPSSGMSRPYAPRSSEGYSDRPRSSSRSTFSDRPRPFGDRARTSDGKFAPRDRDINTQETPVVSKKREKSLLMIKPDAVLQSIDILHDLMTLIAPQGCAILDIKRVRITEDQAQLLYAEHKERPFYKELVDFIVSGDVILVIVAGKEVVGKIREVLGATDPAEAVEGTLRHKYGKSIEQNGTHASDTPESAERELSIFFV